MSSKEENIKRDKYLKKKSNKKKKDNLRKAQAISRKKRSEVRNVVKQHNSFQNLNNKSLLFVMGDTDNMESVLLQKNDIGNNQILLTLPCITNEMIVNYLDDKVLNCNTAQLLTDINDNVIKDIISHYYSITVDEIIDCPNGNMFIIKKFTMNDYNRNMISVNVRPYNLNTWYNNEFSSVNSTRIYKGNKLKTFFNIGIDVSNLYVLQDTILKMLLYKAVMNKIDLEQLYTDIKSLARKGNCFNHLYEIMASDFYKINKRFENELEENNQLNVLKRVRRQNEQRQ